MKIVAFNIKNTCIKCKFLYQPLSPKRQKPSNSLATHAAAEPYVTPKFRKFHSNSKNPNPKNPI